MPSTRFFRKGSQIIATIDIVVSVLSFISIFFLVFLTITHGDRLEAKVKKNEDRHPELAALFFLGRGPFVLIMLMLMLICILYFFLARCLLYAAQERSHSKIRRWCTVSLVIIILRAAFFITAIFFTADRAFVSSFGVVGFLYQIFGLWFVRLYQDRLREDHAKIQFLDQLTRVEIQKSQTHPELFSYSGNGISLNDR